MKTSRTLCTGKEDIFRISRTLVRNLTVVKGQVSCANFVLSQALMYEDDLKSRLAPPSSSQSGQSSQEFDVLIGDKELEQTMGFGEGQE